MGRRETITIPAPIAYYGERVLARNYRHKGAPWEPGTVGPLNYKSAFGGAGFAWSYEVFLDCGYGVGVNDDGIRPERSAQPKGEAG